MNPATVKAMFKREMLDILRDKKTVAMMILLPVLLYPLLIVGMVLVMNAVASSQEEKEYKVAFDLDNSIQSELSDILEEQSDKIGYQLSVLSKAQVEESLAEDESDDAEEKENKDIYEQALDAKKLNAFLRQTEDGSFEICYLSAQSDSSIARSGLTDLMTLYRDRVREELLQEAGLAPDEILKAADYSSQDLSSTEESVGYQIGSFLPFLIITSVLLGAMYPAIDVTAGEKERGTLETLLTMPVSNLEMILSKFLSVSVIASVSAILNVVSMGCAIAFLVSGSIAATEELNLSINFGVFVPGVLFTIVVMIFFAMLITALCMCTCIFAGSFKEANNYITPLMLVVMIASYAAIIPNVELTQQTALIPVVNVSLMIKSLFGLTNDYALYGMVLFANVAYSLLAVLVLSRLYNSEAVLFADGFTSVHIFNGRSDMKKGQMPGGGDVILVLAATLLLMFYIGVGAAGLGFYGVALQQAVVLACPLVYAWYIKADKKRLFSLNKPQMAAVLGGIFMFIGAFFLAMILGVVLMPLFPQSTENVMDLSNFLMGHNKLLTVAIIALMPALGEELLFRGFLMGTLKEKTKPVMAIAVTAILFAAYHMSVLRFFTVGVIGLSFTIAAYKSGSIYVSMLMHFCNNLVACLVDWYPDTIGQIETANLSDAGQTGLFFLVLIGALLAVIVGYILLDHAEKKRLKKQ